jgi:hypothetical protein
MMTQILESGVAYLTLKAAQKNYGKSPVTLSGPELERVRGIAQRQHLLESRVLASEEASATWPPVTLRAGPIAVATLRGICR